MSLGARSMAWPVAALLSAVLLLTGYNAWFYHGENYRKVLPPVSVPSFQWKVIEGEGYVTLDSLTVYGPGRYGLAVAAGQLVEPVPFRRIEEVRVRFGAQVDHHRLSLGISTSPSLSRVNTFQVDRVEGLEVRVLARDLLGDSDDIHFVVLEARGDLSPGLQLIGAELYLSRPSFGELQSLLFREFIDFAPWSQRSVNFLESPSRIVRFSPLVAVAAWVILAILLLSIWNLACNRSLPVPVSLMALLLLGWLILDMSWQATLIGRHTDAVERYAGKSPDQKRAEDVDADVHAFVLELKEKVGDSSRPFVIFGDSNFTHLRARYFSVPQPVMSRRGSPQPVWLARLRPGDVLLTLHLPESLASVPLPGDPGDHGQRLPVQIDSASSLDPEVMDDGSAGPALDPRGKGWLLESPWLTPGSGLWRLEVELESPGQGGWVRLNVLARNDSREEPTLLARREYYLQDGESTILSIPFPLQDEQHLLFRLQQLEGGSLIGGDAWLQPLDNSGGLELLSRDGEPPFLLARRILATDFGKAWEIF
jgi:hypothetical protein